MIQFEIDQEKIPKEERLLKTLLSSFEHELNDEFGEKKSGIIAISFVTDREIQRLNRMYRNKDSVTDVLSYTYTEYESRGDQLGDIAISYAQTKRQASGDVELEAIDLMTHGVLHVLGYDHEKIEDAKRMFPLQDRLVNNIL